MNTLQHWVSVAASLGLVFSVIYLVMEYTIGFIPMLRQWTLPGNIPGRRLVFTVVALICIVQFVTF